MNIRLVINLIGRILLIDSLLPIPALIIALIDGTNEVDALALTMLITAFAGAVMSLVQSRDDRLRPREGFTVVGLTWLLISLTGALPYYLSGYIPSLIDAYFETASGLTTTSATILSDVEALPRGLLFWRSFTNWVGGMGMLVLSLALLPRLGSRSIFLMRAESPGPSPGKITPRIGQTAKILYLLYVGLSVLMVAVLMICGMDWFDAVLNMFGAAGTGGFSHYNLSIGYYQNPLYELVIGIFLVLFGTNFTIYFYLIKRNFKAVRENTELKVYIGVIVSAVLLIALNILPYYDGFKEALRHSFFHVSSMITSAGFVTTNFELWPLFSRIILFLLMLVGCCAGSTGGGIKLIRITMLFKGLRREIRRTIYPRDVRVIRVDGRAVDEEIYNSVSMFFFSYMAVTAIAVLIIALDNFDFETTFTAVIACMSNIGLGMGMVGPLGNFSEFSTISKLILSVCMLLGRLELYPLLMLMSRKTWERN